MSNEVNIFHLQNENSNNLNNANGNTNNAITNIPNRTNNPNEVIYNNESSQEISFIRKGDKKETFGDVNLSNLLIIKNPSGDVAMGYSPQKRRDKRNSYTHFDEPNTSNNLSIFLIHHHYGTIIQQINAANTDYPPQR